MGMGIFHTEQFFMKPAEFYNLIQFWHCLPGGSVRSHTLRAQSHETVPPPLQRSVPSSRSPHYPKLLSSCATRHRFPWTPPPWIWLFARSAQRTQRNTYFTSLLKDTIKDTEEQLDEEIHRVRSERVPNTGASAPMELESVALPVYGCVHQLGSSRTPFFRDF